MKKLVLELAPAEVNCLLEVLESTSAWSRSAQARLPGRLPTALDLAERITATIQP